MRKAKASLIASVVIGLLAVSTAGVSTYAWFQATSVATVTATTQGSTSITVNKPDSAAFYAYKGNKLYDYDGNGQVDSAHSFQNSFSSDFYPIQSSTDLAALTSLTGIYPGQKLFFALKITSPTAVSLKISKLISNNATKQGITRTYDNNGTPTTVIHNRLYYYNSTDIPINIGWAMDIYVDEKTSVAIPQNGTYVTYKSFLDDPTGGNPSTNDKFQFSYSNRGLLDNGSNASQVITLTGNNQIPLVNTSNISASEYYIFYSVVFSNTCLFNEINPSTKSNQTPSVIDEATMNGDRYFVPNNGGNSNCFAGLAFALTELQLTVTK